MRSGSTIGDIRARNRRRILRIGLAVAALAGVGWLGYDAGTGAGEARIEGLKRRIAELEAETRASGQAVEEIRAALDRAGGDVRVWRLRYEEEVPRDREAGLWQLVKRKLDEGVALERLSGVIELVANERRCDAQLTARRIIVRTRLHGGSDTAAGFGQGRITVLGDGQRARDGRE